jgi:tetratricopeptide (TPR) repeat protein
MTFGTQASSARSPGVLRAWPFVVAAAAFAAHARSLGYGLLGWDDRLYVLGAPSLRTLDLDTVRWAFSSIHGAYWLPVTWLSYALDGRLWGFEGPGLHATNVLLHAANAVLVGLLAARIVRARSGSSCSTAGARSAAAVAGVLWAVHPLRVESVAWIAERKDVLSGLFFLLAMHAWLSWVAPPAAGRRRAAYVVALSAAALAMLSKGSAVVLPAAMLILDWHPLGRLDEVRKLPRLLVEKIPFLLLALGGTIMTVIAQRSAMWEGRIDAVTHALVAAKALVAYLVQTAWPAGLSPLYVHPGRLSPASPLHLAALAAVLGATVVAWRVRAREPGWLALWGWYVLACLPALGLVQVGLHERADRFTYLPALAPAILAGAAAAWCVDRRASAPRSGRALAALAAATATVALALGVLSWRQTGFWRDDVALWTRVVEVDPDAGVAYFYRSKQLRERGERALALRDLDASIGVAERKGYHRRAGLYAERAELLAEMGILDEALASIDRALALLPGSARFIAAREAILEVARSRAAPAASPAHR